MYQLSPRQMGRRCEYWPVWHTCQSCSVLSLLLLYLAWLLCCLCGLLVSGTLTSQAMAFPLAHGRRVVQSGHLLSSRISFYYYSIFVVIIVLVFVSSIKNFVLFYYTTKNKNTACTQPAQLKDSVLNRKYIKRITDHLTCGR